MLMATKQAFYSTEQATFKQVPKCVMDATEDLLHDELVDLIIEITGTWEECTSTLAGTFQAALGHIGRNSTIKELKVKPCQIEAAVNRIFEKSMNRGRKNLLRRRVDNVYLKVPSFGGV